METPLEPVTLSPENEATIDSHFCPSPLSCYLAGISAFWQRGTEVAGYCNQSKCDHLLQDILVESLCRPQTNRAVAFLFRFVKSAGTELYHEPGLIQEIVNIEEHQEGVQSPINFCWCPLRPAGNTRSRVRVWDGTVFALG